MCKAARNGAWHEEYAQQLVAIINLDLIFKCLDILGGHVSVSPGFW